MLSVERGLHAVNAVLIVKFGDVLLSTVEEVTTGGGLDDGNGPSQ